MNESLIYDWNRDAQAVKPPVVMLDDETLRDGLQSPSVRAPTIEQKIRILHLLNRIGIDTADIGLPGAGAHVAADVERLAREIVDARLAIRANCAARTLISDIEPIADVQQRTGLPIECCCFIGSSPIRRYAERLDRRSLAAPDRGGDRLLHQAGHQGDVRDGGHDAIRPRHAADAVHDRGPCRRDTDLHRRHRRTRDAGRRARGGCTSRSRSSRRSAPTASASTGMATGIETSGTINSLAALEAGASRVHGTILGLGERVGNTPLDLLLVNLVLMRWIERDLTHLNELVHEVSDVTGEAIPDNYPVFGRDAFRTATGVHAAAVVKAFHKHDPELMDAVYSGVPARLVGRGQEIEVGPMSGKSNVVFWLQRHGITPDENLVDRVFRRAKASSTVLTEREILAEIRDARAQLSRRLDV